MLSKHRLKLILKEVGKRLHDLRIDKNEDLAVVAKAIKVSPARLIKIESGEYDFDLDVLFRLCSYYKTNPKDILSKLSLNL